MFLHAFYHKLSPPLPLSGPFNSFLGGGGGEANKLTTSWVRGGGGGGGGGGGV